MYVSGVTRGRLLPGHAEELVRQWLTHMAVQPRSISKTAATVFRMLECSKRSNFMAVAGEAKGENEDEMRFTGRATKRGWRMDPGYEVVLACLYGS